MLKKFCLYLSKISSRNIKVLNNFRNNTLSETLLSTNKNNIFKKNFELRIKRIYDYFKNDTIALSKIDNRLKELIKNYDGWNGSYAELVAIDYFLNFKCLNTLSIDNKLQPIEGIAGIVGAQEIDLDLIVNLGLQNIYCDIKSLKSTHDEIFRKIIITVYDYFAPKRISILPDDTYSAD